MKKFLANIALTSVVLVVCIILAEVSLRALTPFPIHGEKANKIYDQDAGYRLNPGHPSIDSHGFRNKGEKPHVFAAVGDSHTYGSNVEPEESWPEQFEKMTGVPTYNFGVGSYAVYAYFANAHRALEQGYKSIIIALLIHNDFKVNGNSCDIDYASSEFWQATKQRLNLHLPDCSGADNWRTAKAPDFIRWFRGRGSSAILSATDYLVVRPLSDKWHQMTHAAKPKKVKLANAPKADTGALPEASVRPASAYFTGRAIKNQQVDFKFTDLKRPAVVNGIEDFEKMLLDLKRSVDAKGAKVGVMFIPTKIQLFYQHSRDPDIYDQHPFFKDMARNHVAIEKRLSDHMSANAIPWISAAPEIIAAVEKSEAEGEFVYPSSGGHPYAPGYAAYARSAVKLYERMTRQ